MVRGRLKAFAKYLEEIPYTTRAQRQCLCIREVVIASLPVRCTILATLIDVKRIVRKMYCPKKQVTLVPLIFLPESWALPDDALCTLESFHTHINILSGIICGIYRYRCSCVPNDHLARDFFYSA